MHSDKVEVITPRILEHFCCLSDKRHAELSRVSDKFAIFVFVRSSFEDLTLKRYDIVADVVCSLGEKFKITFVGAKDGQRREMEEWFLKNTRVKRKQMTIGSYCNQSELK